MSGVTNNRQDEITVVHTLVFESGEMNAAFNELAGSADGLPVARGAKGNLFACPYLARDNDCLLYTSPSPRDRQKSRMPSSA